MFDTSSSDADGSGANRVFMIVAAVFVTIIGGSMFLFGFDTYEAKCVVTESAAAEYEAQAQWERDESAERRKRDQAARRYRERTGKKLSARDHGYLRCYRKKTGHVDGVVE